MAELREIVEALIFVHRGVLDRKALGEVLKESYSQEEIDGALEELHDEYLRREGPVRLFRVAGGYEFGTRPDLAEWIQKLDFYEHHRHLSRPSLETLAIIAYRQPVTRPEIEGIRGVSVDRMLRSLLEKKLIRILGRKDVPGKPLVYGTTREFLQHFGLSGLDDLPALKELEEHAPPPEEGEGEAAIIPVEEDPEAEAPPSGGGGDEEGAPAEEARPEGPGPEAQERGGE